ncbi:MAG: EAL domain-containing protein [Gammaproteobacteria bacterium]|nr:EAL domain-containing protein [Gammaproteobacteria bacterium]
MSEPCKKRELVVIADDDPTIRTLMKTSLVKDGFDVIDVENGALACIEFAKHEPVMVLLDVEMPIQDGFSACSQIRRLPGGESVPIVMVTGRDDIEAVEEAYQAGATDFIAKPINWPIFSHRVQYILRASKDYRDMLRVEAKNEVLLNAIPDAFVVLEDDGKVADFIAGKFDHPLANPDANIKSLTDFLPKNVAKAWRDARRFVDAKGRSARIEFAIDRGDDSPSYYEGRFVPYVDRRILVLVSEITARKLAEKRIRRLAFFDTLTGLPNRQSFRLQLGGMIDEAKENNEKVAVLYVDLDNFKRINDTLGHTVGDGVIKAIAERLAGTVRSGETDGLNGDEPVGVARLGGDEFACAISDFADDDVLSAIADRIGEQLRQPVNHHGHEFVVTPSIGISVYPDDAENVEDLLKNADVAMYQAKDAGRDAVRFYSGTLAIRSLHGLALENDLRRALENDELELHYQPKIDLASGRLVGAEALARWRNDEGEYVPPSVFIPMAEKSGQIVPLGDWVLRTACMQARDWQLKTGVAHRIAVNISSQQFYQSNLQDTVMKALFEAGAKPSLLQLELTESILMRDVDRTIATLEYLKSTGITLAMDDFGTGYSSLSYLRRFPIDVLKIDRSFVVDIEQSDHGAAICAAIIAMSRQLGLTVIAEGVENSTQVDFLRAHDCDEIQGFLISKPVPAAEFEEKFLVDTGEGFIPESSRQA